MTFRSDIVVDFTKSPRLIRIPNASNEVTQQDLYDTLRQIEDDIGNASHDSLISGAGKEDLGGGILVGITNRLNNAVIFFAPDTTVIELGTITTGDANGILLKDASATFITNGVTPGATVINFTDQSLASVISVDSEIQLTCESLGGGTDNQFDISDAYKIWNTVQKDITGGNLVANDDFDIDISPVMPTATTQIRTTASSSATLQEQLDIQFASFNGAISIDVASPYSGIIFPVGTGRQPVNNIQDAVAIATLRGFKKLNIIEGITIDIGDDISDYLIRGEGPSHSTIIINPEASTSNTQYENCLLEGTLDGGSSATSCHINDINFVDGLLNDCQLNGTITLSGSNDLRIINCYSGIIGATTPIIDFGGSGSGLAIRNYNGGIQLTNKSGAELVSIDMSSGQVKIESTVTNGTILLRGVALLTYNNGSATVVNELLNKGNIADQVWDEATSGHTTAGTFGNRISQIIAKINAAIGLS